MFTFLVIAFIILLICLLLPKGNPIQEVLSLPAYLFKVHRFPTDNMKVEKHAYGSHRRQYLLLCRPKEGRSTKRHTILYHHGGGWAFGSPEMLLMNAQFFVNEGYNVLLPSYRRTPFYRYPAIWEDLMNGLKKGRALIEAEQEEAPCFLLAGMSAGGNLAALMLFNRVGLTRAGLSPSLFGGIMLFGAPLNLRKMYPSPILYAYCGRKTAPLFRQANPIEHLQGDESYPLLCIHGTKDGMVPFESADSFIKVYQNHPDARVSYYPLRGATHLDVGRWGFDENELRTYVRVWLAQREGLAGH